MITRRHASKTAFTLIEIMIVVAVIALILAIAIPSMLGARSRSQSRACQESQRKLFYAVQEWAIQTGSKLPPASMDMLIGYDKYLDKTPRCPNNNSAIELPANLNIDSIACPNDIATHVLP